MYKPPRRREQLRSANWNWTRHYIHGYCVILWCLKNLSWMPSTCGLTHPLCNYSGGHQSHGYCMILWCWGVPIGNNWSWMPSRCGLTHPLFDYSGDPQYHKSCWNLPQWPSQPKRLQYPAAADWAETAEIKPWGRSHLKIKPTQLSSES